MPTFNFSSDDRLSELPDSLILEILSWMPMRDIVRTTILSKRWKDFWVTIPFLNFDLPAEKDPFRTRIFINQVLLHWKGINIRSFKISFINNLRGLAADMDSWVRFAMEKRVEILRLKFPFDWRRPLYQTPLYWLPHCIYSCSSIKELWISGCNLEIQEKLQWDNLQTLYLHGTCFSKDVINQVVSSAPRLENLHLRIWRSRHSLNIESTSLKTLSLVNYSYNVNDPSVYTELTIWAPKLELLHLWGNAYSRCNLQAKSLTHATLCFYEKWHEAIQETLLQILPRIQHIESVTLSPCAFKILGLMQDKYSLPNHVKKLKLHGGPVTPKEIAGLAQMFPDVETLVIDWKLDDEWYLIFLKNLSLTTYTDSEAKPFLN